MGTTTLSEQKTPARSSRGAFRALAIVVMGALVVGAVAGWRLWRRAQACLPELDGVVSVPGLRARVEVHRDGHGVPHLRAENIEDLVYAQGFVTAQDRLWQMDLSRRLAEGELSEVFGERALRLDIENRTLGFHQVVEREFAGLDPETRKLLSAYARGVNALMTSHSDRLPIEFWLLGYKPRPWLEADTFAVALNMAKTLNTSWHDELMREHVRGRVSSDLYADLFPDHSPYDHPVAELLPAPGAVPEPSPEGESAAFGEIDPLLSSLIPTGPGVSSGLGSNNWVLDGNHTQSGKPLLANDPHLSHSIPSVWYMVHLKSPEVDVSGVSLPGIPLVILGHNERIAWGATNTGPDVQDLYVESFNFRDSKKYLHNGQWVDAELRNEVIKVRDKDDYTLVVKVTRHGPVISHDGDRDLALRWTALEPHALAFPFLRIGQARNWHEFVDALRSYAGPTQNFVYADVEGNIGYYAAGWIPIRNQGDGTVPAPGTTDDYDWKGFIPFDELPHSYNPASGILATANGRIVPDAYPYLITKKWEAPYRTARIYQLLQAGSHFAVPEMLRIQTDILSLEDRWMAKQLLAASAVRPPQDPDSQGALKLLADWDGEARANSAATWVVEAARKALLERILKPKLGDDLSGYHWPMSTTFLENALSLKQSRWRPPGDADFDETEMKSLEEAVRKIVEQSGSHLPAAWKWGETIPLTFHHPLGASSRLLAHFLDVGPFPQSGTSTTVKQTTSTVGPSMRMVVDFSDLDHSVQNITLGESGQALSPYYRDQFDLWYHGQSFPMLFSDAVVNAGTAHLLTLRPAGGQ